MIFFLKINFIFECGSLGGDRIVYISMKLGCLSNRVISYFFFIWY